MKLQRKVDDWQATWLSVFPLLKRILRVRKSRQMVEQRRQPFFRWSSCDAKWASKRVTCLSVFPSPERTQFVRESELPVFACPERTLTSRGRRAPVTSRGQRAPVDRTCSVVAWRQESRILISRGPRAPVISRGQRAPVTSRGRSAPSNRTSNVCAWRQE